MPRSGDQIKKIIEMCSGGATTKETAEALNVSRQYVSQIMTTHGYRNSLRMQGMIDMYSRGATLQEIAEAYGLSETYIHELMSPYLRKNVKKCVYAGLRRWMLRNCTMRELHDRAGIACGRTTFSEKLRGETQLKMDEIKAIMRYTGETFEDLFGEVDT